MIDEAMLQNAVEEQGPKREAGRIAKQEGIDFKDVLQLRLDFRNILRIDNLWSFSSLTKLQLDNNIIEKIEGLDSLKNLIWLDLSFNNIEVIEGLDALGNLEDLSLYNNRISHIENMDHLGKLQVFSMGNNNLETLEEVAYLRRFKNLQTLNLNGNPVAEVELYKMFVAAHLPDLVYLDFRLIDENMREVANQKYQYAIEELNQNESVAQKKLEEDQIHQQEVDLHKAAYIEYLNGPFLYESMFAEDTEAAKLAHLPGVPELLQQYNNAFVAVCQQIFEYGLKQRERREAEVATFFECFHEAVSENQEMGTNKIKEFKNKKAELLQALQHISDPDITEEKIIQFSDEIALLRDCLMTLEIQLVDQLEEIIKDFERNISEMVSTFIENVQGLIAQCRDLENVHHEKILELSISTLEKIAKNEFNEEIPDDLRMLFVDKDTIVNAVSASHDMHLLKIDNREDDIITRVKNWTTVLIQKVHSQELQRNRKRVSEINNYSDNLEDELDNLDLHEPA